jgi:hypothetical protein
MKKLVIGFSIVIFLFFIWLFFYNERLSMMNPIDSSRFADFGTFVSSIFGIVTILFLYYTYQQTKETLRLTKLSLKESKKDSVDATFFNLLNTHQEIVRHLHERISSEFTNDYNNLFERYRDGSGGKQYKDFFELMYAILDLEYKQKDKVQDIERVKGFFARQDWVMGHYFRSIIYFISWIDNNNILNTEDKEFYIGFIKAQLTNDELRLILYYSMFRDEKITKQVCKLFYKYSFFDSVKTTLIYDENYADWNRFLRLVNAPLLS